LLLNIVVKQLIVFCTTPVILEISAVPKLKVGIVVILPLSSSTVSLYPQKVLSFNEFLIVVIILFFKSCKEPDIFLYLLVNFPISSSLAPVSFNSSKLLFNAFSISFIASVLFV
jgi:hypothetical protein